MRGGRRWKWLGTQNAGRKTHPVDGVVRVLGGILFCLDGPDLARRCGDVGVLAVVVVRLQVRDDAVRLPRLLGVLPLDTKEGAAPLHLVRVDEVDGNGLLRVREARGPCGVAHCCRELKDLRSKEGRGVEGRKARREGALRAGSRARARHTTMQKMCDV